MAVTGQKLVTSVLLLVAAAMLAPVFYEAAANYGYGGQVQTVLNIFPVVVALFAVVGFAVLLKHAT